MSNDQKQPPPKQPQAIPCRSIQFTAKRMLPSGNMSDVVQSDTAQTNKPRFTIEYMPALAFYRVAYYGPSATEPTKVLMYPREWGSFEPVPM